MLNRRSKMKTMLEYNGGEIRYHNNGTYTAVYVDGRGVKHEMLCDEHFLRLDNLEEAKGFIRYHESYDHQPPRSGWEW